MAEYVEPTEEELSSLLDKAVFETGAGALTPKQRAEKVFVDHAYDAACSIISLAKKSTNENTRLRAAQYVCDRAMGTVSKAEDSKGKGDEDPLLDAMQVFTDAMKNDGR